MSAPQPNLWDGEMTELKILSIWLEILLIVLIIIVVVGFFEMVNDNAEDNIPEHVEERLLNGDGYWE